MTGNALTVCWKIFPAVFLLQGIHFVCFMDTLRCIDLDRLSRPAAENTAGQNFAVALDRETDFATGEMAAGAG